MAIQTIIGMLNCDISSAVETLKQIDTLPSNCIFKMMSLNVPKEFRPLREGEVDDEDDEN